jgi:thymidylate synthase (FAD)
MGPVFKKFEPDSVNTVALHEPIRYIWPRKLPKQEFEMTVHKSDEADALIGKELEVLDHGFVRLVDYMGTDGAIVQAARVSYGKGTKKVSRDRELIRYLLGHQHTSPFEMVEFKFHVKLPIFVARQWIRHRTANVNEYSGRYSVMKEEFYQPERDQIRFQSEVNKQGRSDEEVPAALMDDFLGHHQTSQKQVYEKYNEYIEAGLARELARINLPLSLYTEWYWKIDLHNLLHFLRLRMDAHAQYEIRQYAEVMARIVKAACPITWEAFEDYTANALRFSAVELRVLKDRLAEFTPDTDALVEAGLSKLEAGEFIDKLRKIKSM